MDASAYPNRTPNAQCLTCSAEWYRHPTSKVTRCRSCRWCPAHQVVHHDACPETLSPCIDCARPSYGERCRPCADTAKVTARPRIRSLDDARVRRLHREMAAPGLTRSQRTALLKRWKQQGRRCTYCPDPATTVDHVVPLVRGGTNHEGNLTPCCRPCNGRKAGLMVSEWRHGKRLPPMTAALAWRFPPARKIRPKRWADQSPLFRICVCGVAYSGKAKAMQHPVCNAVAVSGAERHRGRRSHPREADPGRGRFLISAILTTPAASFSLSATAGGLTHDPNSRTGEPGVNPGGP